MKFIYIFSASLIGYLLVLIQTSLFFRFSLFGFPFPLVFIFVLGMAFFEKADENASFATAFFSGVFMEMYSEYPFGLYLFSIIALVLIIKFVLKNYVRLPAA